MAPRYKSVEAAQLVPLESFQSNQAGTGDEQYHPHCQHRFQSSAFHRRPSSAFCDSFRVNDPGFQTVFHPVGIPFEAQDVGMVEKTVEGRRGNSLVRHHFCPAAKRLVGRQDYGASLVAGFDHYRGHYLKF